MRRIRSLRHPSSETLPYGIVLILAGQLVNIYNLAAGRPLGLSPGCTPAILLSVVGLVALTGSSCAMILRQRAIAQGEPSSMRAELAAGAAHAARLVLVVILVGLAVVLGFVLLHRAGFLPPRGAFAGDAGAGAREAGADSMP